MLARLTSGAIWVMCFAAVVAVLANPATAFEPYGGRNHLPWYSPYPADFTQLYESGKIPTPPYFSLHPPVYYSRPVARTYGYSPYAYPPQTKTPEFATPVAKVIQNQFVPPLKDATKKVVKGRVAAAPVRIINPFVTDGEAVAKSSGGRVKIVYPVVASRGG
jgi:hypothetical protein